MLAVVTLVISLPSIMNSNSKDKAQEEREQKANNKLSTIYRDYIPKKEDKNVYLDWLIEEKKYTKALDLNKNVAYKIGSNLNKDNIDNIKSINAKDNYKILTFYIADYDDKFQTVIENEK